MADQAAGKWLRLDDNHPDEERSRRSRCKFRGTALARSATVTR
jgi:hypothetical protein